MAGLIVKSPYLKCGGGSSVSGYLRYIGTRERVEILPDDRPPTRKQEQLITKLTKDFPEAKELGIPITKTSPPRPMPLSLSPERWRKTGLKCSSQTAT